MRTRNALISAASIAAAAALMTGGSSSANAENPPWASHWAQSTGDSCSFELPAAAIAADSMGRVSITYACSRNPHDRAHGIVELYVDGRWMRLGTVDDSTNDRQATEADFSHNGQDGMRMRMRACVYHAATGRYIHCGSWVKWNVPVDD